MDVRGGVLDGGKGVVGEEKRAIREDVNAKALRVWWGAVRKGVAFSREWCKMRMLVGEIEVEW